MSSNQIAVTHIPSRPTHLSRARGWAKGALLTTTLGAAMMFGLSVTPALAAPAIGTGAVVVYSTTPSPYNGTGGPTGN